MCFSGESPKVPAPQKHTAGSRRVQTMPAKHTSYSSKPLYKLRGFTARANVNKDRAASAAVVHLISITVLLVHS